MIEIFLYVIFISLVFGFFLIYYNVNNIISLQSSWTIFFVFTLSPIFIKYFIDTSSFWDIRVYSANVQSIRSLNFDLLHDSTSVDFFSWLLASVPIILEINHITILYFSKFIYFIFFLFLLKKKIVIDNSLLFYFLIFSPSIIFYSSVPLRDISNLIIIFLIIYNLSNRKYIKSLIFIFFLSLLKFELSLIFTIVVILHLIFFTLKKFKIFLILFSSLLIIYGILLYSEFKIINIFHETFLVLNFFKYNLFTENLIAHPNQNTVFEPLKMDLYLLYNILLSTFNFIFTPIFSISFNDLNIKKLIILIEIFFIYIYFILIFLKKRFISYEIIFFLFTLLIIFIAYGIISFNDGTISRWRISFIIPFLILFNSLFQFSIRKNKK